MHQPSSAGALTLYRVLRPMCQGSVDEAAECRKRETQTAERLAAEAAEVKKKLGDNGGKQRDVSHATQSISSRRY